MPTQQKVACLQIKTVGIIWAIASQSVQ